MRERTRGAGSLTFLDRRRNDTGAAGCEMRGRNRWACDQDIRETARHERPERNPIDVTERCERGPILGADGMQIDRVRCQTDAVDGDAPQPNVGGRERFESGNVARFTHVDLGRVRADARASKARQPGAQERDQARCFEFGEAARFRALARVAPIDADNVDRVHGNRPVGQPAEVEIANDDCA